LFFIKKFLILFFILFFQFNFLVSCKNTDKVAKEVGKAITDEVGDLASKNDEHVQAVKYGTFPDYPDIKLGDAFENFFASPKWKYFVSTEGKDVIEFTGFCTYGDSEVKARFQFTLLGDNSFETGALSFNDVPQDTLTSNVLLQKVFEDYSTNKTNTSSTNNSASVANSSVDQSQSDEEVSKTEDAAIDESENLDTAVNSSNNISEQEIIPGFLPYQSDGFMLQLPTGWSYIISDIEYTLSGDQFSLSSEKIPVSEKYDIKYKADDGIHYNTDIQIISKESFEKDKTFYLYGDFISASIKNADVSYSLKKYSNSLIETSEYKIVAIKNDAAYIISARFSGYNQMEASGSYYDFNKNRLEKYLNDIDIMLSSFELTDTPTNFQEITQTSQDYMSLSE
jgi:hypothetical protein